MRSRDLRNQPTLAEYHLWQKLRNRQIDGYKFRRQHPLGSYIVDFVCLEASLVLEIDGGQHADSRRDHLRDAWLKSEGYRVLRLWNFEVLQEIEGTVETIRAALSECSSR